MKLKDNKTTIDYKHTKHFFDKRGKGYDIHENDLITTMYQDKTPEIAKERNKVEQAKLQSLLHEKKFNKVLDVGCGTGRLSCLFGPDKKYLGLDFSEKFIDIANKTKKKEHCDFEVYDISKGLSELKHKDNFDLVLISGVLIYLNDKDVKELASSLLPLMSGRSMLYLREPVYLERQTRLTLKNFFSQELESEYNAIYRSEEELKQWFINQFIENGYSLAKNDFLYENASLNNRKETVQKFYFLTKGEE